MYFQETSTRYRAVEPSSGSNVFPRRARPGLAGLRPDRKTVLGSGIRVWNLPVSDRHAKHLDMPDRFDKPALRFEILVRVRGLWFELCGLWFVAGELWFVIYGLDSGLGFCVSGLRFRVRVWDSD